MRGVQLCRDTYRSDRGTPLRLIIVVYGANIQCLHEINIKQ